MLGLLAELVDPLRGSFSLGKKEAPTKFAEGGRGQRRIDGESLLTRLP
jgi:hypothetical protein